MSTIIVKGRGKDKDRLWLIVWGDSMKDSFRIVVSMGMGFSILMGISMWASLLIISLKTPMVYFCGRMEIYTWETLSTG